MTDQQLMAIIRGASCEAGDEPSQLAISQPLAAK
jgi:hypothetical protein